MTDTTSLTPEGLPPAEQAPAEHGVFQSASLLFVFLLICIFIALAIGISFALQWITASLLPVARSLYSPMNLALSEGGSLAGALVAGGGVLPLGRRSLRGYGPSARGAVREIF